MIKRFLYTLLIFVAISLPAIASDFKITDVKMDYSGNIMLLKGNSKSVYVNYSAGFSDAPLRAYIDLDNAIFCENKKTIELKNNPIKKINIAQFQTHPNKVRLVFYSDSPEALKNIKLVKNGNALTFKLTNFKYEKPQIPVLFSDILPKEYEEEKAQSIDDAKFSKYILTNVMQSDVGILFGGVGTVKLSRPFILTDPIRIVFDVQNAIAQKKEFYGEHKLGNGDTVKIGQFTPNTLRFVVTTENPVLYKAFISPDLQSIFLANIDEMKMPPLPNSKIVAGVKSIGIKQTSKDETFIGIEFDAPVVHSLRRTYNKFLIEFMNVDFNQKDKFLTVRKTDQFDGFIPQKISENIDNLALLFPVHDNLKVETGLSQDGKALAIKLTQLDEIEQEEQEQKENLKNQIIIPELEKAKEKIKPKKEKKFLPLKNKVIVVDAGHGGKDVGAVAGKMYEKVPALEMAIMVKKHLEENGAKVIMTRSDDTYLTLKDRVSISNYENADMFVSIHLNSSEKSHINGVETHWYKNDSKELALAVHNQLVKNVKANDRGLFKSMFYVINHTYAPAILVETGFISNPQERNELFAKDRQKTTAKAIADGIIDYYKR